MANYDFKKDLPVAKETEKEVAQILAKVYDANILKFEHTSEYDILARIKDNDYKFEVKEDFMSWKTGNVALEFECRGKPSGIQTSEADFYVYKIHGANGTHFYLFKTSALKKMVSEKEYFRVVSGGDKGSNSMNYLFKYETFVKYGKFIL
jgi:hypothetical protein